MRPDVGRSRGSTTTDQISLEGILSSVAGPCAGGRTSSWAFRDFGDAGRVQEMTYEAHAPLARSRPTGIARETSRRRAVGTVRIGHRLGRRGLREISVPTAVSSSHRQEAFEAGRFAVNRVRKAVPIWKKEGLSTGAEGWMKGERMSDANPTEAG